MIEYLPMTSIVVAKATHIRVTEEEPTWMDPIRAFLEEDKLPNDRIKARRLKLRALWYVFLNDVLYKRGLSLPYLRCLSPIESKLAMREIHEKVQKPLGGQVDDS